MRLCVLPILALAAFAQETPTFKTGVSLVHVDAEVVTYDGRLLTGFTKDDFRVLDEGKEQPIVYFSAGLEPLDLILLFDVSGSMKPKVKQVASAAREGMEELWPGDRVAILTFNTRSRLVLPFTDDLKHVRQSIERDILNLPFGGGTLIQDAVWDAVQCFRKEPKTQRRRAVLIITDDEGAPTRKEASIVREYWEADALLTGLIVTGPAQSYQSVPRMPPVGRMPPIGRIPPVAYPPARPASVGVKGIADQTGGDFVQSGDPAREFPASMRRIRSRYTIYYAMPEAKPGTPRSIRVVLAPALAERQPGTRIRARTGYVTPAETPR